MEKLCGDFHVDMSGKIARFEDIGIACMNPITKVNCGCAIRGKLVKKFRKEFFKDREIRERAKLYGILIYLIIQGYELKFDRLIICNDEDFKIVKKVIVFLMGDDFNSGGLDRSYWRVDNHTPDSITGFIRGFEGPPSRWIKTDQA